jgi:hypothetical protein
MTGLDGVVDPALEDLVAKNGKYRYRSSLAAVTTKSVNFFVRDDSGEIFCKISRHDYDRMYADLMNGTRQGKSLFYIKGRCPADFRMLWVTALRYMGESDGHIMEARATEETGLLPGIV